MGYYEPDDCMGMRIVDRHNTHKLAGCYLKDVYKDRQKDRDVIVFHNPYKRTCIDLVFDHGELCITDEYGDTMPRSEMDVYRNLY